MTGEPNNFAAEAAIAKRFYDERLARQQGLPHRLGTLLMKLGCWTIGLMLAGGSVAALVVAAIESFKAGTWCGVGFLVAIGAVLSICAGGILRRDTCGVGR